MKSVKEKISELAKKEKGWSLNRLGIEMVIGNNIYRMADRTPVAVDFLFEVCEILNLSAADAIDLYLAAGYFPFSPENPAFKEFCNVYLCHRFSDK